MTLAIAHSRGWLDYEQPVCAYWPEFLQNSKERITIRQLLAHQAGLFAFDETVDRSVVADLDRLALLLSRQKPAWEPGTRQAYHALSLGFYEGELLRRVDPQHRSLGQFFQDEVASRLGEDVYIRLPEAIPNSRLATLAPPSLVEMLRGFGLRFMLQVINPRSQINRALNTNPGTGISRVAPVRDDIGCLRDIATGKRKGQFRAPDWLGYAANMGVELTQQEAELCHTRTRSISTHAISKCHPAMA